MRANSLVVRPLALFATLAGLFLLLSPSGAQISEDQLRDLLPAQQDLPDFSNVRPAGELPPLLGVVRTATTLDDWIRVSSGAATGGGAPAPLGVIKRELFSKDGLYRLYMRVIVAVSVDAALAEYRGVWGSGIPQPGALLGQYMIGDRSVAMPLSSGGAITCLRGRVVVSVDGMLSGVASRDHVEGAFPAESIEAVAHIILARLAKYPNLTGVGDGASSLSVNGRAVSGGAVAAGKTMYCPVEGVTKAAGWTCAWDRKAGTLDLRRGGATIKLKLLSLEAKIGAIGGSTLSVPPFLLNGQPTMDLAGLVGLLGGKVVSKSADRVSVKI